jgi:[ribosomal protein S5]-alanine N-acetyltransferase
MLEPISKEFTMSLELKSMSSIPVPAWLDLLNHPRVKTHMPLATEDFTPATCAAWLEAKERVWAEHGFGPHAFVWDGELVGWGGYQPDGDDADLGVVLHPRHWGLGLPIAKALLTEGFERFGFSSVIVLLPPSRTRLLGLQRFGFQRDGEVDVLGLGFMRFRLRKETWLSRAESNADT